MTTKLEMPRGDSIAEMFGVEVEWTPEGQRLRFGAWYDGGYRIKGDEMTLREFFDALGITLEDCTVAFYGDEP